MIAAETNAQRLQAEASEANADLGAMEESHDEERAPIVRPVIASSRVRAKGKLQWATDE